MLGLSSSFSRHSTASRKHSNKKKKKGLAGREGRGASGLKGSKRRVGDGNSTSLVVDGSADWTLGSAPSRGTVRPCAGSLVCNSYG